MRKSIHEFGRDFCIGRSRLSPSEHHQGWESLTVGPLNVRQEGVHNLRNLLLLLLFPLLLLLPFLLLLLLLLGNILVKKAKHKRLRAELESNRFF